MQAPRICLWIAEDDLRSWITDELLVMTWIEAPMLTTIDSLSSIDPSTVGVIVVGLDGLSPEQLELLRTRTWRTPVIAIGRDPGFPCEHLLGPRLTSRELKQALRATLPAAQPRSLGSPSPAA